MLVPAEVEAAGLLVRRVAAFGLPGSEPEPVTVGEGEWRELLGRVVSHRLTGLATAGLDAGWLGLGEGEREQLLGYQRTAMMQALALERMLLAVGAALDDEGIEMVVLKGPALAHSLYPDPSWRPYADLDVLVRGRDWRRACALLGELGFHRRLPEPRPGFDERFGKAAAHRRDDGLELDLHRTLVVGPFGLWMEPDMLFDRTAAFQLGGRTFRRLDDSMLLLHACMHASLGWTPPLLLPLRDVAQVVAAGEADWDAAGGLVERWRLRPVIHHAFAAASDSFGVTWPTASRALVSAPPTRRERKLLAAYTTPRRRRGGTALTTIRAIPGIRQKLAYLRDLLFPQREFLTARAGGARHPLLTRWIIPLRWLMGKR